MNQSTPYFRPSFNKAELETLLASLAMTEQGSKLYRKVNDYLVKISVGINQVSYVKEFKPSLEQSLGLERIESEREFNGPDASAQYFAKLSKRVELGAESLMTPEERYNYLAGKVVAGEQVSETERAEGAELEQKLYGMSMGMFATGEQ